MWYVLIRFLRSLLGLPSLSFEMCVYRTPVHRLHYSLQRLNSKREIQLEITTHSYPTDNGTRSMRP